MRPKSRVQFQSTEFLSGRLCVLALIWVSTGAVSVRKPHNSLFGSVGVLCATVDGDSYQFRTLALRHVTRIQPSGEPNHRLNRTQSTARSSPEVIQNLSIYFHLHHRLLSSSKNDLRHTKSSRSLCRVMAECLGSLLPNFQQLTFQEFCFNITYHRFQQLLIASSIALYYCCNPQRETPSHRSSCCDKTPIPAEPQSADELYQWYQCSLTVLCLAGHLSVYTLSRYYVHRILSIVVNTAPSSVCNSYECYR